MSCLLVKVLVLSSLSVSAQESIDHTFFPSVLRNMAQNSLGKLAQKSGVSVSDDAREGRISFAESNWPFFILISPLVGRKLARFLKLATTKKQLLQDSFVLSFIAAGLLPPLAMKLNDIASEDVPFGAVWVPGGGHYRAELHYALQLDSGKEAGSCLLFFVVDREAFTADYEIDNCTHKDIFPENIPGGMRVGGVSGFFDESTGQTLVAIREVGRSLYPLSSDATR